MLRGLIFILGLILGGGVCAQTTPEKFHSPEFTSEGDIAGRDGCRVWNVDVKLENENSGSQHQQLSFDDIFSPLYPNAASCLKNLIDHWRGYYNCIEFQPDPFGNTPIDVNDTRAPDCFKRFGYTYDGSTIPKRRAGNWFDENLAEHFLLSFTVPVGAVPPGYFDFKKEMWPKRDDKFKSIETSSLYWETSYSTYYDPTCTPYNAVEKDCYWHFYSDPNPIPGQDESRGCTAKDERCWIEGNTYHEAKDIGAQFGPPQYLECHHFIPPNIDYTLYPHMG